MSDDPFDRLPPPIYYVLNAKREVVPVRDVLTWGRMFEKIDERRVALTLLGDGLVKVSTVFLGMDHNWSGKGPPVVFETMIFTQDGDAVGGFNDNDMQRYCTWSEAEVGHMEWVEQLQHALDELTANAESVTAETLARVLTKGKT